MAKECGVRGRKAGWLCAWMSMNHAWNICMFAGGTERRNWRRGGCEGGGLEYRSVHPYTTAGAAVVLAAEMVSASSSSPPFLEMFAREELPLHEMSLLRAAV